MSIQTTTPVREFIIVGQDQGTGYTLWDVAPAPTDPARRAAVLEELGVDAMDALGQVSTEWATTPRQAVARLLETLREQTGLDDYGLTPDSRTENLGPEEPTPVIAGDVLRRALKAAGIDGDVHGTWMIVDLPCGAEIWIADRVTSQIDGAAEDHHGWSACFYSTGADSSVRRDLYSSHSTDLDADTTALVAAVTAAVHATHHETLMRLAPHTLADISAKLRPHLPEAAFLTLDAADGTLRAVLDANRKTLWYAPTSPLGLPEAVIDDIERLADLLLIPEGMRRIAGHDDTCEVALLHP